MTISGISVARVIGEGVSSTVVAAPFAPATAMSGTSHSTMTIALGMHALVAEEPFLGLQLGSRVRATDVASSSRWFEGPIVDRTDQTLTINADLISGAGSCSNWVINIAGQPGARGVDGVQGPVGPPGGAPLNSPTFTGNPQAPTPPLGDNDTSIATTAFVQGTVGGKADLSSPIFTGNPTAPTPTTGDSDTSIATTAFVNASLAAVNAGYVQSVVDPLYVASHLLSLTIDGTLVITGGALGIKPDVVLPGAPMAATPSLGDDSAKIATTSFVAQAMVAGYQPLDGDLTALAALGGTNTIYYRSAASTWSPVSFGSHFSFTGGTVALAEPDLVALAALTGTNTIYYRSAADTWSPVTMGTNMSFVGGVLTAAGGGGGGGFITGVDPPFVAPAGVLGISLDPAVLSVDGSSRLALVSSLVLPGTPALTTAPSGADNSNSLASTAWVRSYGAPLASPVFTGDPKAPTPGPADNDTSIATTAFVQTVLGSKADLASPFFSGDPRAPTPTVGDNDTSIATTAFVTAAVATGASGKANLASPTFTGDPQAPTPATADDDTSIATTAFVKAQAYAPLASPVFTGTPLAPTPSAGNSSTSVATTAFVATEIAASRIQSKVVIFTRAMNAATGSQSVTGVGFVPTCVVFIGAEGGTGVKASWGVADSSRLNGAIFTYGVDLFNASTSSAAGQNVIRFFSATGTTGQVGSLASYDSDGFTISWTLIGSPAAQTHYITALCLR